MQFQSSQRGILKRDLPVRGVENYNDVLKAPVVSAIGVKLHDDKAGGLARSSVQEMQVGLHFGKRVHVKKAGGAADLQQFAERVASARDIRGLRLESGISEQRLHN